MWKLTGRLGNQMFQHAFIYAQMKHGIIPDIYLQSPEHFDEFAGDIKKIYGTGVSPVDQVAIHVRRGDYVRNPFYVDLIETDYYERAMSKFPNADFLVFSDDIEFCKLQRIFKDCDFSEGNDEVTDMNLMAGCAGHIIANSSFSWWSAFISPFSKKVIAPIAWYTDGEERTKCPDTWIKI